MEQDEPGGREDAPPPGTPDEPRGDEGLPFAPPRPEDRVAVDLPAPEPARRSGLRRISFGAVGLVAVVLLVRFGLPAILGGSTLIEEDFTDPDEAWGTFEDADLAAGPAEEAYVIAIHSPEQDFLSGAYLDETVGEVRIEADVSRDASGGSDGDLLGIACDSNPESRRIEGYLFVIGPGTDFYAIGTADEALATGQRAGVLNLEPGAVNRIRGDCRAASGDRPATLVMYLNGEEVLRATDPGGSQPFSGVGLFGFSGEGGSTFRYDNVVMARL